MIDDAQVGLAAAFLMGLLGSAHCAGMCGGIAGAVCVGGTGALPPGALLGRVLGYNAGRILSYSLAGVVVGAIGARVATLAPLDGARTFATVVQAVSMLAVGLYLIGLTRVLAPLERLGGVLWRRLAPLVDLGRRVQGPVGAVLAGMVWGWLPCGLVYAALGVALGAGGAAGGGLVMATFGAGTVPMMVAIGVGSATIARRGRRPWLRRLVGAALVLAGVALGLRAGVG
ncbi:MAG: sulfite exporter TauE/SafE family protein [Ectothiorhodospiraceae bacterium]|nr:sulfite exporter TauE/SafE family protein [Chromatiales bacterium]MCP5153787.1 sulfite exporter TauE/SafE family protein [Ectothiorhodospiraceae bacterium]